MIQNLSIKRFYMTIGLEMSLLWKQYSAECEINND